MNLLMEIALEQGFMIDGLGLLGLMLVVFASIRMARRLPGSGAVLITWGALALLFGRLSFLCLTEVIAPLGPDGLDPTLLGLIRNASVGLLTGGLGVVVWGFWSHERGFDPEEGPI